MSYKKIYAPCSLLKLNTSSAARQKKTVILPIREYQRLLEDLHDLTVVAERHKKYPVSLDEMEAAIHKRGSRLF